MAAPALAQTAKAALKSGDGKDVGAVELTQTPAGVLLKVLVKGLPPGEHAFHVHAVGKCEPPFDPAGGHFNPGGKKHGLMAPEGHHAGDMPNLHIPQSGELVLEVLNAAVTLEPCNAQAIGSASLQSVPVATVHAPALADAGMLFELYASLSNEMAAVQDLALTIGRADPEERLARFLLVLSRRNQRHGRDPTGIDLSMPRIDIADHSTASRGIYFRFTIDAPGENPDAPGAVLPFGANLSFAMNSWPGANPEAPLAPPEFPRCAPAATAATLPPLS